VTNQAGVFKLSCKDPKCQQAVAASMAIGVQRQLHPQPHAALPVLPILRPPHRQGPGWHGPQQLELGTQNDLTKELGPSLLPPHSLRVSRAAWPPLALLGPLGPPGLPWKPPGIRHEPSGIRQ